MTKLLTVIFLSLSLMACTSPHLEIFPELKDQDLVHKKLTLEQMREDIDALVEGTLIRHPDLASYANVEQIKKRASQLKAQLSVPLTRTEFFKVIGQLSYLFEDGHSFLLWPYQEYTALKEMGETPFPFDVKLTSSGELVLARNYQLDSTDITVGGVIRSINGVASADLLNTMQQFTGGESEVLRKHTIANRFPIMLWAVYGWISQFDVELEDQFVRLTKEQQWNTSELVTKEHYWKKLNQQSAYLYLDHFDVPPDEFEEFIDSTFEDLKRSSIENLVIDIRNNPGGNTDTVIYLSRYLANKPFRLVSAMQEKLNEENRGWFNYKGDVGEIISTQWEDWEQPVDPDKRFTGKTYVLIGPISYSAAIVFATTVQDNQFAELIGEPTGGYANQSAQGNLFNLPHSQLRAYISTRLLVRPSGDTQRSFVIPDHQVKTTAELLASGRDTAVEKALALISGS